MNNNKIQNKYFIFRHGETFATRDNVPYGEFVQSAEILEQGIPAIKRLAQFLKMYTFSKFYTSEYLRCIQTAQIVEETIGMTFEKYSKLNEYTLNGNSSFEEFHERLFIAVEHFEMHTNRTYLICTHGAVIAGLKHLLLDNSFNESDVLDYPPPGNLLVLDKSGLQIKDFNN